MTGRIVAGWVLALVVLSGAGYASFRFVESRKEQACKACSRHVHSHSKTIAMVDGKRSYYCCPSCALSEHRQSRKPVEVVELTDHLTGAILAPANAFFVRNSDVNPCRQHMPAAGAVGPDKRPLETHYDRCEPSVLAFRSRGEAEGFARDHGGQVLSFAAVAEDFKR